MSDKSGNIGALSIFLYILQFSIPVPSHLSEKIFCSFVIEAIGPGRLQSLLSIIINPLHRFI